MSKKKIGIMSMHRIVNYGSFLQAYALKKTIEDIGYDVEFIDYKIESAITTTRSQKMQYNKIILRNKIYDFVYLLKPFWRFCPLFVRSSLCSRKMYETFCYDKLGITAKRKYRTKVDTLVIGSDEVFNCMQLNPRVGYSRELFGKDANASKVITYAASFGNTTLDLIDKNGKREELSTLLSNISALSARDGNTGFIMKTLTEKPISYNFDPVLMYDFSNDIPNVVTEENYIVVYAYSGRLTEDEILTIKKFAKERNKKIITIGGYHAFSDKQFFGTPFEMLAHFKNADYVFTDTFHGAIFSIISRRPFVTFIRTSKNGAYGNVEKLTDLLNRLGLSDRIVSNLNEIIEKMARKIDYDFVYRTIMQERQNAKAYLKGNL